MSASISFNACCNKNADCLTSGHKCVTAYQAGTYIRRVCADCALSAYSIPPGTNKDAAGATWSGLWKVRGCPNGSFEAVAAGAT